jgi:cytochrome c biogenesis protein CcdA
MERAGFISLILGAVVVLAFTVKVDSLSLDYITLTIGVVMVLTGLVMLHRCDLKRTKMLE